MDDYISKPVRRRELLRVLRQLDTWEVEAPGADSSEDVARVPCDLQWLRENYSADPDELRELLEGFLEQARELLGQVREAMAVDDAQAVRRSAHTLKGAAANIGAAASAPIVAAHHRPSLVPVSILMALLGYAMGNYLAPLAGTLAKLAAGQ